MPFIVFEGLDGSGKTTLLKRLQAFLEENKTAHIVTREPGGTPLAEEIRQLLLDKKVDFPQQRTEVLLYEASRAQHVETLVKPALAQNKWVLCDRFSGSTFAFQCGGRGLDFQTIAQLDEFATGGLRPDLTVLLDISVVVSDERKAHRQLDRMESENREFHERVRTEYLRLAKSQPNWLVLDSSKHLPDQLFESLRKELQRRRWLA